MWAFQSNNIMEIFIVAIHTSLVWVFFHDACIDYDHMCTLLTTFVNEINDLFLQHTDNWSFNHLDQTYTKMKYCFKEDVYLLHIILLQCWIIKWGFFMGCLIFKIYDNTLNDSSLKMNTCWGSNRFCLHEYSEFVGKIVRRLGGCLWAQKGTESFQSIVLWSKLWALLTHRI